MTDVVRGSEIGVYVEDEQGRMVMLAYGTECELEKSREVTAVAMDADGWQRVTAGRKSWSITSRQLVGVNAKSAERLDELHGSGAPAGVVFGTRGADGGAGGVMVQYGKGMVTELRLEADNRSAASISVVIDGDGDLLLIE